MTRIVPFLLALAVHMSVAAQAPASDDSSAPAPVDAAASTPEIAPPDPEREEALRRFQIAVERSDAGDCEAAVAEFEEIYRLLGDDPRRANVLFNMGICYEQLLRFDEAITAYDRFLSEQPSAPQRAEVERSIRRLDGMLGTLEIRSNVPASVWVGEREVGQVEAGALTVRVPSGSHTIELRAPGHEAARQEVTIASGMSERLSFQLDALSDFSGIRSGWVWATGAAAVAVAVAGGISGGIALSRSNIEGTIVGADMERVATPALVADILFGVAGVLGIATIVLFTVADWDDENEEGATLTVGPAGVSLRGRF